MRMDKYSSPASYSYAGLVTFFGALSLNEWAVLIGILTGIGTFAVNWYYKHKDLKERREYRMKAHEKYHR